MKHSTVHCQVSAFKHSPADANPASSRTESSARLCCDGLGQLAVIHLRLHRARLLRLVAARVTEGTASVTEQMQKMQGALLPRVKPGLGSSQRVRCR